MRYGFAAILFLSIYGQAWAGPACDRAFTLALHEHGLLYSAETNSGIDKDLAEELIRRSGCKLVVSVMPRARIWQLIESGALDFSLSGITNSERDKYASFAWYMSNKYYLLVRNDAGVGSLADFERNPNLKIGVIRGFRYSPSGNRLVDGLQPANRVNPANGLAPLYEALALNLIQGMIIEPFDYPTLDTKNIRSWTSIIEFNDVAVPHGLIMSKTSQPPAEQAAWRRVIDDMRADGAVRRIFAKVFPPDLAATMADVTAPQ